MKKPLLLAPVVLIAGYAVAIIARLAGYTSFNVLPVSAAVGGMVVCSLLLLASADYARKPRFRVRSARKTSTQLPGPEIPSPANSGCGWTYTTRTQ
jgi:hypothetical protein